MKEKILSLLKSKGFQRYFKNTSWLLLEKFLRLTVGLYVGVWVTRYLGPERYGLLSYAQSFVAIFAFIASLGLDTIFIRESLKKKQRVGELIGTTFTLKVLGAILVIILILIVTNSISGNEYTNFLILIISFTTFFQSFNVIDFYFQSQVISKFVVYSNIISLALSSLLKVYLIYIEAKLDYFVWTILLDSIIIASGLLFFFFTNSRIDFKTINFKKSTAILLLKDSWPLLLSSAVISLYMKIDQIMIKEMLDLKSTGLYSAAVRLSEATYFLPMIISSSLFPAIINAKKKSNFLYLKRLQRLYNFLFIISISISITVTYFSKNLVFFLYGQEYIYASNVLIIHIWASIFVFGSVAASKWIVIENLQIYANYFLLIGLISNIILNFIFIPNYGIIGASIITLISQFLSGYLAPLFFRRTRLQFIMLTKSFFLLDILNKLRR